MALSKIRLQLIAALDALAGNLRDTSALQAFANVERDLFPGEENKSDQLAQVMREWVDRASQMTEQLKVMDDHCGLVE